jgi:hypothetical protein
MPAAGFLHVQARVRNLQATAGQEMFVALYRTSPAQQWFDFDTGTWVNGAPATAVRYAEIPADTAVGEFVYDGVPVTTGGTYSIFIGRFPTTPATPDIANAEFALALASAQFDPGSAGDAFGARPPLITDGSQVTRVAESLTLDNAPPHQFWFADRGAALFEFRPWWRADLMPPLDIKPLARSNYTHGWGEWVRFVRDVPADVFYLSRYNGSVTWQVGVEIRDSAGAPISLTRDHVVRVFAQWNGEEGSEQEAPYQMRIAYAVFEKATGALLGTGTNTEIGLPPIVSTAIDVDFGHDSGPAYLDGWLRMMEVRRNPLFYEEALWRR